MATNAPDQPEQAQPALPNGTSSEAAAAEPAAPPVLEPKVPGRRQTSLKEFLNKMDDHAPIVSCLFATR